MAPWVEVAIVGEDTLGKPVGQLAFDLRGCDVRLRLVAFRTVNALDRGDYYDGLAETLRFACAAIDTLDRPLGDATEGLTAAALEWLRTGACAAVMVDPAARSKSAAAPSSERIAPAQAPSPGAALAAGRD